MNLHLGVGEIEVTLNGGGLEKNLVRTQRLGLRRSRKGGMNDG